MTPDSPQPGAAPGQAADWGVHVNECGIFATRHGVAKWVDFQLRVPPPRLVMLWTGPGGGEWHLLCGTRQAAAEARDIFTEQGIHPAHVKVARRSACTASMERRRNAVDERFARYKLEEASK